MNSLSKRAKSLLELLFDLIQGMTVGEKRNFTNNFLKGAHEELYHVLNKASKFDEKKIQAKLEKKPKAFDQLLQEFKKDIYSSLSHYHIEAYPQLKAMSGFTTYQILYQKGQNELADKLVDSIDGYAEKSFDFATRIEIARNKVLDGFRRINNSEKLSNLVEQQYENMERQLELLQRQIFFEKQLHAFYLKFRVHGFARSQADRAELRQMESEYPIDGIIQEDSFHAKIAYFFGLALYHQLLNTIEDQMRAFDYYLKTMKLWDENEENKQKYLKLYLGHWSNFINICLQVNDFERFKESLEVLKGLEEELNTFDERAEYFQALYHAEILLALNDKQPIAALEKLSENVKNTLVQYADRINKGRVVSFCTNLALLYFFYGNPDKCRDWITEFGNQLILRTIQRDELFRFLKVLEVISYWDMKEYNLAENCLENNQAWLNVREIRPIEQLMMRHMNQLIKEPDRSTQHRILQRIESGIQEIIRESAGQHLPGAHELKFWAQSKFKPGKLPIDLYLEARAQAQSA